MQDYKLSVIGLERRLLRVVRAARSSRFLGMIEADRLKKRSSG